MQLSIQFQKILFIVSVLTGSCLTLATGSVQAGTETIGTYIQGGHSGVWHDADQPGYGLFAEVLDDDQSPSGKRMLVGWFGFIDGRQIWLLATGPVTRDGDGQVAHMQAWIYEGNDFPPRYDASKTMEIPWGTISVWFVGCDQAIVIWDSIVEGYGSGEVEMERLTKISDSNCDPDFGGTEKPDDHGDTWETGTRFPTHSVYNDSMEGKLESRSDVDVFIFTLTDGQAVAIFTISNIGTRGLLYRLEGDREIQLMVDERSGVRSNFLIEDLLNPGTYTIHVSGDEILGTGDYTLWLQTQP